MFMFATHFLKAILSMNILNMKIAKSCRVEYSFLQTSVKSPDKEGYLD